MDDPTREERIAEAVGEWHRRRARGERPSIEEYRQSLGDAHADFVGLLETESAIDAAIEPTPVEPLPRPFGAYTLLKELGRGAVGVVYEAVHRDLGRRAAVKILKTGFDTDPTARERFRRETRASAQVRHDHIVEIYEAGEVDGRPFYAMELVEGKPLSALVRDAPFPDREALCRGLAAVADALDALHRAGIVHRDVKPSNIMLRADGRMILADFGHARVADSAALSTTGEALGTPLYMSPEQMLGKRDEVDARSDVYALGATLYEALTGKPVFKADEIASLVRMILAERPVSPRQQDPSVPPPLEAIAMKALEKRREDRYSSAAAMRDDLLAFAEGREVTGKPVSRVVRAARAVRRRWIPLAVAAVVAIAAGWWWEQRSATLSLLSLPSGAQAFVDGVARGTTPVWISLSPGSHEVVLKAEGYRDFPRPVTLPAGGFAEYEWMLAPADENDAERLQQLALLASSDARVAEDEAPGGGAPESLAAAAAPLADPAPPPPPPAILRAVKAEPPLLPVWPRGNVRLSDLDRASVEITDRAAIEKGGTLQIRRGDEVLLSVPYAPKGDRDRIDIPADVRRRVKPGDSITWGWWPKDAKDADACCADVRVVPEIPRLQRERFEERVAHQDPAAAASMRMYFLLLRGLVTAAVREAEATLAREPHNLMALSIAWQGYKAMGLKGADRAKEIRKVIDGPLFTDEQRARALKDLPKPR